MDSRQTFSHLHRGRSLINTSRFYECGYRVAINQAACARSRLIADYRFTHTSHAVKRLGRQMAL